MPVCLISVPVRAEKNRTHEFAEQHDLRRQDLRVAHDLGHDDPAISQRRQHVGKVVEERGG